MRRALLPLQLASAACTPVATQTQLASSDVPPPAATAEGYDLGAQYAKLAVIAIMYELSDECNADLEPFWNELPMEPGDAPFATPVDAGGWLAPLLRGGYYAWDGSLTGDEQLVT